MSTVKHIKDCLFIFSICKDSSQRRLFFRMEELHSCSFCFVVVLVILIFLQFIYNIKDPAVFS